MNLRPIAALLVAWLGGLAFAQEPAAKRVEVQVTASSGASFYVDQGSDAGLEPGDRVRLFPVGRPELAGLVKTVTRNSARCELANAGDTVEVGTRGDIFVPEGRAAAGAEGEHPPWSYPAEEWSQEMPLLAPPRALTAAEREMRFSGRWFTQLDSTWDHQSESQYLLGRTGVDLLSENPFGQGGGLRFDAELYHRSSSFDGSSEDDEDTRFRLDRLSYHMGGTREGPRRFEVGRFLQHEFPEFGVLDGIEFTQRLGSGDRVGASVGFMPEPFPEMKTGEDFQVAGYYRHFAGAEDEIALGLGVQKTWAEGEADRDLMVATAEWRPSSRMYLYGAAWVDYYGSNDDVKDGVELTEMHVSGTYRFESGNGFGLGLSRIRWPELLRDEFAGLPPDELDDSEVTRVHANAWRNLSQDLRLSGRVNYWEDEDDSGGGGALRVGWRDLFLENGEIGFEAFTNDASFTRVLGGRVTASKGWGRSYWNAAWEVADYEQKGLHGDQAHLLQQDVRLSFDRNFDSGWSFSLYADQRFGEEQDATSMGFYLQRRF